MPVNKHTSAALLALCTVALTGCSSVYPSFLLSKEDLASIASEATRAGAVEMVEAFESSATYDSLDAVREAVESVEHQVENQASVAKARDDWVSRAETWMTGNTRGVADNKKDLGQVRIELSSMATNQRNMGDQLDSLIGKLDYALMGIAGSLLLIIINMALKRGAGGRDPPHSGDG